MSGRHADNLKHEHPQEAQSARAQGVRAVQRTYSWTSGVAFVQWPSTPASTFSHGDSASAERQWPRPVSALDHPGIGNEMTART
jgi:hypothetical protein